MHGDCAGRRRRLACARWAKKRKRYCNRAHAASHAVRRATPCPAIACHRWPRIRIVLVRTEPSRQHRRRGARDADDGPRRGSCSSRRSAFRIRRRWRWRPARRRCSTRRGWSRRSTRRSRACVLTIGLSARPREFAGRVLPVREAAARGGRAHARDGDVALVFGTEMSGLSNEELARCTIVATIPVESRVRVAQPRGRGAGGGLRVASRRGRRRRVARTAIRTRDGRRDRGALRAREANAGRDAIPRPPDAAAAAAAAAAPVRARGTREGGGQHPARDPRADRSVRRTRRASVMSRWFFFARRSLVPAPAAAIASSLPDGGVAATCRNCGAAAPGAYCPACGQETKRTLPTLREFMREAAGRYVALDGRLWRTLGALLFRPGIPDARVPCRPPPPLYPAGAPLSRREPAPLRGVADRDRVRRPRSRQARRGSEADDHRNGRREDRAGEGKEERGGVSPTTIWTSSSSGAQDAIPGLRNDGSPTSTGFPAARELHR